MTAQVADYYPLLKAAIAGARAAGLEAEASELEAQVFAAFTTSSELLGEHGVATLKFLRSQGVPVAVAEKLNRCLTEICKSGQRYDFAKRSASLRLCTCHTRYRQ
jgi:hypothetical protein